MSKSSAQGPKWVAKPLVSLCGVCGNPADSVKHYGALACYSCRAFFRRATNNEKRSRHCARKSNSCNVDSVSRNNCKSCRYEKCLKVGMRPEKVDRVKKKHLDDEKVVRKTGSEIKKSVSSDGEMHREKNFVIIEDKNPLDIDALVEECVNLEVIEKIKECEVGDCMDLRTSPSFNLTHEEEFKIFELFVRKENLMDGLFKLFFQFPGFLESFQRTLLSIGHGKGVDHEFVKIIDQKYSIIESNLTNGGTIRQSLDMFDEFKNVSEKIKNQVLTFSLSVFRVCNRALVKVNVDKEYFLDQHIAAGVSNDSFRQTYEMLFPNDKYAVKSFDPFSVGQFTSPWAVRQEDEDFFLNTVESVGSIVKDDVQLGALYSTLILATPGATLAEDTKNDPALQQVQGELSLLLYRYCKNKFGNSMVALDTTNNLLKLLGDLHICRDIFMFGRLSVFTQEVAEATIDQIEVKDLFLTSEDYTLSYQIS